MAEILEFSLSDENRLQIVANRIEKYDYLGAIEILLDLSKNNNDYFINYELGRLYYLTDNYEYALDYFFKSLLGAGKVEKAKSYNGIAGCYYNMDNLTLASYYYEQQMKCGKNIQVDFDEDMYDFFDEYTSNNDISEKFSIVDDTYADKKVIDDAKNLIIQEKYEEAECLLKTVDKSSKVYYMAEMNACICAYITGNGIDAIERMIDLHNDYPDDASILENLINMLYSKSHDEESKIYADKLIKLEIDDVNEEFKILSVLCSTNNDLAVKKYVEKIVIDRPDFIPALYVLGVANYNLGNYEESYDYFKKHYLTTKNYVSKYYSNLLGRYLSNEITTIDKELTGYFFSYPEKHNAEKQNKIEEIVKLSDRQIKKIEPSIVIDLFDYAFSTRLKSYQKSTAYILSKFNKTEYNLLLAEKLTLPELSNEVKSYLIYLLCYNGFNKEVGLVYSDTFVKFKFYKENFSKNTNPVYKQAYAYAYGKIAPFYPDYLKDLRSNLFKFRFLCEIIKSSDKITDYKSVAVVVVILSKLNPFKTSKTLIRYFDANDKEVRAYRELYKARLTEFNKQ